MERLNQTVQPPVRFDPQVNSWRNVHQTKSTRMMNVERERSAARLHLPSQNLLFFFLFLRKQKGGSGIKFILLYNNTSLRKSWSFSCITINNLDCSGTGQNSPKKIFRRA